MKMKLKTLKFPQVELWEKVLGFKWYKVSNMGRIKSLTRTVFYCDGRVRTFKGKILSPGKSRNGGYLLVVLRKNKKSYTRYVHQLVAEAFLPPKPLGYETNHKNGRKDDCRASNLEWKTHLENMVHAVESGLLGKWKGGGHEKGKRWKKQRRAL